MTVGPARLVAVALVALTGCATTGGDPRSGFEMPTGSPAGTIVRYARGPGTGVTMEAAFGPDLVVVALDRGGSKTARLDRTASGAWRGGTDLSWGYRFPEHLDVEIAAAGGRITGPSIDVRVTPVAGGLRLEGLWLGTNVDLELTDTGAKASGEPWTRDLTGAYVSSIGSTIVLGGAAANLREPVQPQLALALLLVDWRP